MRILMVSKACLVGAYQTKLELIADDADLELMVIVPPEWRDPSGTVRLERMHTDGYKLEVEQLRFNGHYHLHYYPHLKSRIRDFEPDVLHIDEEPYNLATWKALRAANGTGCRTVFFSWQNISRSYPWPFSRMEKSVLQSVDFAIFGNHESAEVWKKKGYRGPHKIIPQFGVSTNEFKKLDKERTSRSFVIGAPGRRLVREKGIDLVIKSASRLKGEWTLRIAGEGPERQSLEKLAVELGTSQQVIFDGLISSGDMPAYLNQLDAVVLASRTRSNWKEQFGRVIIEAMACEVPVVGSDSGEIPNVIGEAGLIFPEGDVEALSAHLKYLMDDVAARQNLGKKGLRKVNSEYTQRRIAERTVDVYQEMMARDG